MSNTTITTLFLAALLLFASVTAAARPEPAHWDAHLPNDFPVNTKHADPESKNTDGVESCDGVEEVECLMRRTLNAHTDYIYTQDVNP